MKAADISSSDDGVGAVLQRAQVEQRRVGPLQVQLVADESGDQHGADHDERGHLASRPLPISLRP